MRAARAAGGVCTDCRNSTVDHHLLIIIATAIVTTKIPELTRSQQGFWYLVSDVRTDFAMLMCLLFLLVSGSGPWSGLYRKR